MPTDQDFLAASSRVIQRSRVLAECSDSEEGLARLFCSDAMRSAHDQLRLWMAELGMSTRVDAAGNLVGRRSGATEDAKAVLIGSHLDTVVNAGRFDGTLGVLLGLAVAELCQAEAVNLPVALDVIGFSEEEGIRYQSPYIGSRAIVGDLRPGNPLLERLDDSGIRMADALEDFGCNPEELSEAAYQAEDVVAFLEPHIEQGPVLEEHGNPLGVVSGIAGQTRACFRFAGETGHAGTVPMPLRKDPLPTAARFVAEVEQAALRRPGTMATVGRMEISPNVANVIPAEVAVRIDLRHVEDAQREHCFVEVHRAAMAIAQQAGISCQLEWCEEQAATWCDTDCQRLLTESLVEEGYKPENMVSGAGHDAVVMASRFPTGLLFLRCAGGLSHHPDESVTEEDVAAALRVLWRTLIKLADGQSVAKGPVADRVE